MKHMLLFESFKNLTPQDRSFLPFIRAGIEQYQLATDKHSQKKLKEAVKTLIMKWTDQPVSMVSAEALRIAEAAGLDPFKMMWPQRDKAGRDERGRSLLVWEHTTPVEELFQQFVTDPDNIEKAMQEYSGVAWISREENDKLDKKHRAKRPGGWEKIYKLHGIEIIRK